MKIQMVKNITLALCLTLLGGVAALADDKGEKAKAAEESAKAAESFREIMGAPDKAIPHEVLDAAECVAVFPNSKKGAFIVAYRGRLLTHAQAAKLEARGNRYMFEISSRWTVDGSSRRNIAR